MHIMALFDGPGSRTMLGMKSPLLFPLIVLAAACNAQPAPVVPDAATTPSVTGHWTSACFASPQADGSTLYARLDLTGTDPNQWSLDYTLHGDAQCSAKVVTISIHGEYDVIEPSKTVSGAWDVRFGFDDKTITPFVQPVADALGGAKCGTTPWQVGVAQSVYAGGCLAFGQYPQTQCPEDYDLLSVDGTTLRFGNRPANNDMCTPDKRPTQLSTVALTRS
jgi:hypothetical protein